MMKLMTMMTFAVNYYSTEIVSEIADNNRDYYLIQCKNIKNSCLRNAFLEYKDRLANS